MGIFDSTAIVGANGDDDHSGSAHFFALNNNIWRHQAKIVAPDGVADNQFGYSVGIFGNAAIIGAYGDGDNGVNSGAVYLFAQNEDALETTMRNSWLQKLESSLERVWVFIIAPW